MWCLRFRKGTSLRDVSGMGEAFSITDPKPEPQNFDTLLGWPRNTRSQWLGSSMGRLPRLPGSLLASPKCTTSSTRPAGREMDRWTHTVEGCSTSPISSTTQAGTSRWKRWCRAGSLFCNAAEFGTNNSACSRLVVCTTTAFQQLIWRSCQGFSSSLPSLPKSRHTLELWSSSATSTCHRVLEKLCTLTLQIGSG